MRQAAVKAGLVPDTAAGRARIAFVTEGEASLHFAIKHGLPVQATKVSSPIFTHPVNLRMNRLMMEL